MRTGPPEAEESPRARERHWPWGKERTKIWWVRGHLTGVSSIWGLAHWEGRGLGSVAGLEHTQRRATSMGPRRTEWKNCTFSLKKTQENKWTSPRVLGAPPR